MHGSFHAPRTQPTLVEVRRTEQKEISISFLGLVATPYKVRKVMGLCREILGGLCPERPPKAPKEVQNLSKLMGTLWEKTASPKKEGENSFCSVLRITDNLSVFNRPYQSFSCYSVTVDNY